MRWPKVLRARSPSCWARTRVIVCGSWVCVRSSPARFLHQRRNCSNFIQRMISSRQALTSLRFRAGTGERWDGDDECASRARRSHSLSLSVWMMRVIKSKANCTEGHTFDLSNIFHVRIKTKNFSTSAKQVNRERGAVQSAVSVNVGCCARCFLPIRPNEQEDVHSFRAHGKTNVFRGHTPPFRCIPFYS